MLKDKLKIISMIFEIVSKASATKKQLVEDFEKIIRTKSIENCGISDLEYLSAITICLAIKVSYGED